MVLLKYIKDEIKVDQLRGFIGENVIIMEKWFNETIMGELPCSSNNINLFKPGGQLGTRLMEKMQQVPVMFSLVLKSPDTF